MRITSHSIILLMCLPLLYSPVLITLASSSIYLYILQLNVAGGNHAWLGAGPTKLSIQDIWELFVPQAIDFISFSTGDNCIPSPPFSIPGDREPTLQLMNSLLLSLRITEATWREYLQLLVPWLPAFLPQCCHCPHMSLGMEASHLPIISHHFPFPWDITFKILTSISSIVFSFLWIFFPISTHCAGISSMFTHKYLS